MKKPLTVGTEVKITAAVKDAAPQMVGLRAKVLKTYKSKGRQRVKIAITEGNPCYRIGEEICLQANMVTPVKVEKGNR